MERHQRIVCSAVLTKKGEIVLGVRHYDPLMNAALDALGYCARTTTERFEEGFIDNHRTFLNREEAYIVAKAANQILYPDVGGVYDKFLYSECIC